MSALLDLVHPPICLVCGAPSGPGGEDFCPACAEDDTPLELPPCAGCSRPGAAPRAADCSLCKLQLPWGIRAVGRHRGLLRTLILGAKWSDIAAYSAPLIDWAEHCARRDGWHEGLDGVVAVPRTLRRRLLRGTPLSELVAAGLRRRLSLPSAPRPRRLHRPPQGRLDGARRRRNLRGAFSPPHAGDALRGRRLLLVDDVVTTGSTLRHCAQALLAGGARDLRLLVISVQEGVASREAQRAAGKPGTITSRQRRRRSTTRSSPPPR